MGAKNCKKNDLEKTSISSVYEKSLNSNSSRDNPSLKNVSREDLLNEIKEEINLPLENEFNESPEIIFEEKGQSCIQNYFCNDGFFNSSKENDIYLNKFYPTDDYISKHKKIDLSYDDIWNEILRGGSPELFVNKNFIIIPIII